MTQDFSHFRPSRLWRRMPPDRRAAAARLFWADDQSSDQHVEAIAAIASHLKFRTKSVLGLPLEKRARYLSALPAVPDSIAARALVNYHLETQRPMMSAFLDSLDIAHENGLISEETVTKPESERLRSAAAELSARYPAADVALYLATLVSQDPDTWGELAEFEQTQQAG